MLAGILSWLARGGLTGLASEMRQAQKDKLSAANDKDKLAADERIKSIALRMEAQTKGEWSWMAKLVRGAWALPFIIYTSKVVVWDKVLGLGVTDPLGPYEQRLGIIIVSFFFLDATFSRLRR